MPVNNTVEESGGVPEPSERSQCLAAKAQIDYQVSQVCQKILLYYWSEKQVNYDLNLIMTNINLFKYQATEHPYSVILMH